MSVIVLPGREKQDISLHKSSSIAFSINNTHTDIDQKRDQSMAELFECTDPIPWQARGLLVSPPLQANVKTIKHGFTAQNK